MGKKTTTLTLDEETVKKAKKIGINISELTDGILKSFTFEPVKGSEDVLKQKYSELFQSILSVTKSRKIDVTIGHVMAWDKCIEDVLLQPSGKIWATRYLTDPDNNDEVVGDDVVFEDLFKEKYQTWKSKSDGVEFSHIELLPPKSILHNLLVAIEESEDSYKKEIKDIELVKRVIEAISPNLKKGGQ